NPFSSAMLRAGDLADRATYYRHDLAYADIPGLSKNGHGFMTAIGNLAWKDVALAAQEQIATFFETDGQVVVQPEPVEYFEVPIQGPLPESLNYIPTDAPRGAAAPPPGGRASGPTRSRAILILLPAVSPGGAAAGAGASLGPPWIPGSSAFSGWSGTSAG